MKTKSIIFTEPCRAELIEEELSPPKEHEVIVKLAVSSISSGTERANLIGDKNVSVASNSVPFPRRSGYSSAGEIIEKGVSVKDLNVGDRVALSWSTHSEYVCINEKNVHKILDSSVSYNEAALWHISTFPAAAIRKCRLEFGESAVVMGMGILGLIAVKLLRCAGAVPVIAVDPISKRRQKALEAGADYALNPASEDFKNRLQQLTNGGADIAVEVTGNGAALDMLLDGMAKFGRVALLGCTRNSDFTIDYYRKVHAPGISLIGAHTQARPELESSPGLWTTRDDVAAVQKLFSLKRLELQSLVDEIHPPCDAPTVYTRLAEEKDFPITQFDWRTI